MEVHWLEQSTAEVASENDWLSACEQSRLDNIRFPKRRGDWRLGRWTAKRAVAVCLNLPQLPRVLATIEIRPAASGEPQVFLENRAANVSISISHRNGVAACAVAPSGTALGCDVEVIEPRSDAFIADYFTSEEQAIVGQASTADRFLMLALLWSAKESALKAIGMGLRLDTRSVSVSLDEDSLGPAQDVTNSTSHPLFSALPKSTQRWRPLRVRYANNQLFEGWWQRSGELIRTLAANPAVERPILLAPLSSRS